MTNDTRLWAHQIADLGVRVFPLYGVYEDDDGRLIDERTGDAPTHQAGSGKKPRLGTDWRADGTLDHVVIDGWFDAYPLSNYGCVMGEGIFVLDCDSDDAVDRFETTYGQEEGEPVHTMWVKTGLGVHYWFKGHSASGKPADEMDMKGVGGYVVGPGCRSWAGVVYEASDVEALREAPSWVPIASRTREQDAPETWEYLRVSGNRNDALAKAAGQLVALGLRPEVVNATIRLINKAHLDDPLDEQEIEDTIDRVAYRYAPGSTLQDMIDVEAIVAARRMIDGKFYMRAADRRMQKPPTWTWEGLIPGHGVVQLYGGVYTGKTFVSIDMAMSLCNGQDWMGFDLKQTDKPVVLYIMAEGAFDFQQRINAWTTKHGGSDENLITVEEQALDLTKESQWVDLWRRAQEDPEVWRDWDRIGLVVLDTQSLLLAGAEENSNTEMNRAIQAVKTASKLFHCPVVLVHHAKASGEGGRGAMAVSAACDTIIKLKASGEERSLEIEKVKAGKLPKITALLRIEPVDNSAALVVESIGMMGASIKLDELFSWLQETPEVDFRVVRDRFNIITPEDRIAFARAVEKDPRFILERRPGRAHLVRLAG